MEKVGRNQPCPCGSGKKYKFCCSPSSINMLGDEIGLFKRNRDVAYAGQVGARRKNLCTDYMLKKQGIFEELARRQSEITSSSSAITCRTGCHHCCILMVGATIQEVELIVHHLYQNEELFDYFIDTYPGWISKLREVEKALREHTKPDSASTHINQEKLRYDCNYLLSASLDQKWKDSIDNRKIFSGQKLYCPFLREGKCSIYEVRPFYCAGYIATTPGEWCDPLHPGYLKRRAHQTFDVNLAGDLSFCTGELKKPVWSFMPIMVYDTLKYGPSVLQKMKIMEGSSMKYYTASRSGPMKK